MKAISVTEAVAARRSIRMFTQEPVDLELLRQVLDKARQAPSGGNVQPWHATVLTGARLERLKQETRVVMMRGPGAETPEYEIYPSGLPDPWRTRRGNGHFMDWPTWLISANGTCHASSASMSVSRSSIMSTSCG